MSQIELARLFDVRPATVRAWTRQGCPVEKKSEKAGQATLYRPAEVIRWREEQARMAASGDLDAMNMEEAKRRKLAAEAASAELALARDKAEVVAVSLVAKEVGSALAACRSRLLQVGSKVAPHWELVEDAAAAKELIDDAIYEALDAISDDAFAFGGEAAGDAAEDDAGASDLAHEIAAEADPERMG